MLFQCCPTVFDAGPTLKLHWMNAPCFLGSHITNSCKSVLPTNSTSNSAVCIPATPPLANAVQVKTGKSIC